MYQEIVQAIQNERFRGLANQLLEFFRPEELWEEPDEATNYGLQVEFVDGIQIYRDDEDGQVRIPSDLLYYQYIDLMSEIPITNHDETLEEISIKEILEELEEHIEHRCSLCLADYQRSIQKLMLNALDELEEYAEEIVELVVFELSNPLNFISSYKISVIEVDQPETLNYRIIIDIDMKDTSMEELELVKDSKISIIDEILDAIEEIQPTILSDKPYIIQSEVISYLVENKIISDYAVELYTVGKIYQLTNPEQDIKNIDLYPLTSKNMHITLSQQNTMISRVETALHRLSLLVKSIS